MIKKGIALTSSTLFYGISGYIDCSWPQVYLGLSHLQPSGKHISVTKVTGDKKERVGLNGGLVFMCASVVLWQNHERGSPVLVSVWML